MPSTVVLSPTDGKTARQDLLGCTRETDKETPQCHVPGAMRLEEKTSNLDQGQRGLPGGGGA